MMIHDFLTGLEREPRRLGRWLLAAGALALVVLDMALFGAFTTPTGTFRLEVRSPVASVVTVFFDTGRGFVEGEGVARPVEAGTMTQLLVFPLPSVPVRGVRIDPLDGHGTINLHGIRVVRDRDGREMYAFDLESVVATQQIARLSSNIEGLEIVTEPSAAHPQLALPLERPINLYPTPFDRLVALLSVDAIVFAAFFALVYLAFYGWPARPWLGERETRWLGVARRWFPDGWAVLLFSLLLVCAVCVLAVWQRDSYYLEAVLTCDRPIVAQFYFDAGHGYSDENSARVAVPASPEPRTVRVPFPLRTLTALRFDPAEGPVAMRVKSIAIRSVAEDWLGARPAFSFNLRTLWPIQQMTALVHEDDGTLRVLVADGFVDPATGLTLPTPWHSSVNWFYVVVRTLYLAVLWLLLWIVAAELGHFLFRRGGLARSWAGRLRVGWRRWSPAQAVWLVAAASVVLSCYPVIFCGKSFASPNFSDGTDQLYEKFPTLPGSRDARLESGHGTELGPVAWQAAPAVVESRAIFRDHELPLWNRYNEGGVPLLGQGQSMLGDPLHWLVIAAGGRAWAWDVKFLLAKGLFAAGVGLLVLAATECVPAALLLTFSAAFIGFFSYRLNHPATFSLCDAPWILLAWVELVRAATWRRALGWVGGLILANWMEMNSGSFPDAFAQVLYLNVCGVLLLLLTRRSIQFRLQRLFGLTAAALIFLLLAAPLLAAFFALLKHGVAARAAGLPRQLPLGLLIGLFDDIFYRHVTLRENVFDPSTNTLVLAGVLLALSRFKHLLGNRVFVGVLLSALLPLAAVFGLISLGVVGKLPLGGSILRPDAVYSGVLIIHLFVLAGFGLQQGLRFSSRGRWFGDWFVAVLAGLGLVSAYGVFMAAPPVPGVPGALTVNDSGEWSSFFYGYAPLVLGAAALVPVVLRQLRFRGPTAATVLLLAACLFLIHWRQGIQLDGAFARYTPTLPDRVDLLATSKAVDFVRADRESPFRSAGPGADLMPGYSAVPGLEGIDGPEALVSPFVADLKAGGLRLTQVWLPDAADKTRLTLAKRFYNLYNVRYYVTLPGDSLASVPGLRLIGRMDLDVYRNEEAWPRAFFVDRLQLYDGVDRFLHLVNNGDGRPFAAIDSGEFRQFPALANRFSAAPAGRTVVPAAHYRLTSRRTAFDVDAPRAGVIVLTEAFYADTVSARVNGKPARVFRVNHAFCGIAVDQPGPCHVTVVYGSPSFGLALCASILGLALLAAAAWRRRRVPPVAVAPDPLEPAT